MLPSGELARGVLSKMTVPLSAANDESARLRRHHQAVSPAPTIPAMIP
jgi:hypothetical protein